jgi:hypothetical protein
VANSRQVKRYCERYGQVLVTSYCDVVLVARSSEGKAVIGENYRLAKKESDFWNATARPRETAKRHEAQFVEYLKRVMLHPAPLAEPKDVAWFLASYARDALGRIEHACVSACNFDPQTGEIT